MKHLGDITKISGHTAPTVDVIIGGSPCQDLSIAGKRAGLDGERSGLFMEQIRIIKEMRENAVRSGRAGADVRPRYMVWENVPGALSSNRGEDFRTVLEETAKVADKDAVIPQPDKGKWTTSGCIMGDGWSIAWRILDAQFWGVPQRRRRIALVADFGGESAPEILFVRKSVSGDTEQGKQKGEGASSDAEGCTGADDRDGVYCFEPGAAKRLGGYVWEGLAPTLRTEVGDNRPSVPYKAVPYTLKIRSGCEGGGKGALIQTDKSATLSTLQYQTLFQPVVYENHSQDSRYKELGDVCETVSAKYGTGGNNQPLVVALDRAAYNQGKNAKFDIGIDEDGTAFSCIAKGPGAVAYGVDCRNATEYPELTGTLQAKESGGTSYNLNNVVRVRYIVRRLTPLECERLQGFPDGWTLIGEPTEKVVEDFDEDTGEKEGEHIEQEFYYTDANVKRKKASDAARYKALGNSIAIPPWKWVLKRLCACYERDATMASLFDGIGGFPYIWEQINGKGSCLWVSEIEEFPIAVTKARFGECT